MPALIVAPLALRLVSGVVPPTAPPRVIPPAVPAVSARVCALLIVLVAPVKVMLAPAGVPPALVVSMVVAPPSSTGPVSVNAPPAVI